MAFHPDELRDAHGKWTVGGAAKKLASDHLRGLRVGQSHESGGTGTGIKVKAVRSQGGGPTKREFHVSVPGRPSRMIRPHQSSVLANTFPTAEEAASHALDRSARTSHPNALGGEKKFKGAAAFAKSERVARRKAARGGGKKEARGRPQSRAQKEEARRQTGKGGAPKGDHVDPKTGHMFRALGQPGVPLGSRAKRGNLVKIKGSNKVWMVTQANWKKGVKLVEHTGPIRSRRRHAREQVQAGKYENLNPGRWHPVSDVTHVAVSGRVVRRRRY